MCFVLAVARKLEAVLRLGQTGKSWSCWLWYPMAGIGVSVAGVNETVASDPMAVFVMLGQEWNRSSSAGFCWRKRNGQMDVQMLVQLDVQVGGKNMMSALGQAEGGGCPVLVQAP